MKTVTRGHQAEIAAAQELRRRGYKILDLNWKTKLCEIDIVALKEKTVYFVEVKFRSNLAQGDGLVYIGPQKLHRLHFAASIWVQTHDYSGDYQLMAAAVSNDNQEYIVQEILEI